MQHISDTYLLRAINNQPHAAFMIMMAEQHDRVPEMDILQRKPLPLFAFICVHSRFALDLALFFLIQ